MITTGKQIRAARAALNWTQGDLAERASLHFKAVAYWERHDTITARQCAPNSGPIKMLAAFKSAGVDLVSSPQPGVLFEKVGSPRQRLRGGKYDEAQSNVLGTTARTKRFDIARHLKRAAQ